jgi:hypothetical protein
MVEILHVPILKKDSSTKKFWSLLYFIIIVSYESILKKPEKAQTFLWEPVEGFILEPRA